MKNCPRCNRTMRNIHEWSKKYHQHRWKGWRCDDCGYKEKYEHFIEYIEKTEEERIRKLENEPDIRFFEKLPKMSKEE